MLLYWLRTPRTSLNAYHGGGGGDPTPCFYLVFLNPGSGPQPLCPVSYCLLFVTSKATVLAILTACFWAFFVLPWDHTACPGGLGPWDISVDNFSSRVLCYLNPSLFQGSYTPLQSSSFWSIVRPFLDPSPGGKMGPKLYQPLRV